MAEIETAINELRNGTSAGTSDIPPEFIKAISPAMMEVVHIWVNCCWKEKAMPDENNLARSILLHKKGPSTLLQNYRTLAVGCNICKLYMRILYNRIECATENINLLGDSQAGFRKGMELWTT